MLQDRPVGNDAEAVLEDTPADEEDRGKAGDGLAEVLDGPDDGALGVPHLGTRSVRPPPAATFL